MANLNTSIVAGRLTKDPIMRSEEAGVVNMVVAVNYRVKGGDGDHKEYTDFVPIAVFGRTGELCKEKLKKGSAVLIEGRVRSRSKEINGERRYFTEVVAKKVDFLDRYVKGWSEKKESHDDGVDWDENFKESEEKIPAN